MVGGVSKNSRYRAAKHARGMGNNLILLLNALPDVDGRKYRTRIAFFGRLAYESHKW